MPQLLEAAVSVDLYSSHGATLALGQVVLALSAAGGKGAGEVLNKSGLLQTVEELVDKFVAGTGTHCLIVR